MKESDKLEKEQIGNFRRKLKMLRRQSRTTQANLADKLGLLHQDISALETGRKKVTMEIVNATAEFFHVPVGELLKSTGSKESKDFCIRLLDLANVVYKTPFGDLDNKLIDQALGLLETVVYRN